MDSEQRMKKIRSLLADAGLGADARIRFMSNVFEKLSKKALSRGSERLALSLLKDSSLCDELGKEFEAMVGSGLNPDQAVEKLLKKYARRGNPARGEHLGFRV